jgi:hypothetical protein
MCISHFFLPLLETNKFHRPYTLTFLKNRPKKYAPAAYFKIGRFGKLHTDSTFQDVGLPEPIIAKEHGGISITFLKDIYTEEYLKSFNLNERQIKGVLYIKENGEITNAIYQLIITLAMQLQLQIY